MLIYCLMEPLLDIDMDIFLNHYVLHNFFNL